MSDPCEALQLALVDAAEGHAGLVAAMGGEVRIYDDVPPDVAFPFIALDSMAFAPEVAHSGEADQAYVGGAVTVIAHIWTREPGTRQAKKIGAALSDAWLAAFTIAGWRLIDADAAGSAYARQISDDPAARGISTFRYDLQALA